MIRSVRGLAKKTANSRARQSPREREKLKRANQVAALLDREPWLTTVELSNRTGFSYQQIYKALKYLGRRAGKGAERRGNNRTAESQKADLEFAKRVFGVGDYDAPKGMQDEAYRSAMKLIGRPGFFYIGETWAVYRDFWEHKEQGLTFAKGKWRKATANDGVHTSSRRNGAILDRSTSGRPLRQQRMDANWDDFEDWF